MPDAPDSGIDASAPGALRVTVTEHLWIPMPDGTRLAARLWLPRGASQHPVPGIFEYIPYRKADMVRARDERTHPWFAANGYACLRVDMRGSGDSEGLMADMYSDAELSDARHVIDWIAAQPWCDGRVGMFGTSWGGTAALQANLDAPGPLKAVIAVCATHDRYEDDIHHKGGCLLTDTFEWGATLPAILAAPPTPEIGADWKRAWQARLQALHFPVEAWLREEARGAYWRRGSVIHEAARLSRPVLAVGGWSDRYSNSVMSLVAARPELVWGVVGPWGHHYPDHGHPGPAIGFQQLALEWWDRWLRPDRPARDWPRLRVWLREFDPPGDALDRRRGRWIETGAPATCTRSRLLHLAPEGLSPAAPAHPGNWPVPADLRVGRASGDTGYFGRFGGLPSDQRDEDALSLSFETPPLEADLVLYGAASLRLCVGGGPMRQLSLRLNDVAGDGSSARVALAVRNLALDANLDAPQAPLSAEARALDVPFHTKAYRFRRGHRIRLSIAASYWPTIWPSASLGDLRLLRGALVLPVFEGRPPDLQRALPPALDLPEKKRFRTSVAAPLERFMRESETGELVSGWRQPFTETCHDDTGTAFGFETRVEHRITRGDPTSAISTVTHSARYSRPDGVAEIASALRARCDAAHYMVEGTLTADWDGARVATRAWDVTIPRRFS